MGFQMSLTSDPAEPAFFPGNSISKILVRGSSDCYNLAPIDNLFVRVVYAECRKTMSIARKQTESDVIAQDREALYVRATYGFKI